jgi:hypothetical protein
MAKKRKGNKERSSDPLKAAFDAAHATGMEALKKHDFPRLSKAIGRERELIQQQKARLSNRKRRQPK